METRRFTEDELAIAKSVDLCQVAASLGYTVQRIGKYHTIKEMDSIRIYNRTNWFRWSRQAEHGSNGGSQIDFLRVFEGLGVKEAVFWLLDFAGYRSMGRESLNKGLVADKENLNKGSVTEKEDFAKGSVTDKDNLDNRLVDRDRVVTEKPAEPEHKPFILPERAPNNVQIIKYLTGRRCISMRTVENLIDKDLIYESAQYHNVVFLGRDASGAVQFASMRGTYDKDGKAFKCDVAGSDKRYGFHVEKDGAATVSVFEAAIDLMSYMDIFPYADEHLLALGMVADKPLEQYLSDHPGIRGIRFCLDNDGPGRQASLELAEKYLRRNYTVRIAGPPDGYKDYNEWIVDVKTRNGVREVPKTR